MVSAAVKRARAIARAAKARWKRERIARMLEQIATGRDRDVAIAEARALGSRLQEIGSAVGLTRERIRQICQRQALKAATDGSAEDKEGQTSDVQERRIGQSAGAPERGQ